MDRAAHPWRYSQQIALDASDGQQVQPVVPMLARVVRSIAKRSQWINVPSTIANTTLVFYFTATRPANSPPWQ